MYLTQLGIIMTSDLAPDPSLTPEQRSGVKALTPEQVQVIDAALLSNVAMEWRKVARVVGATMLELQSRVVGIPDVYYAERVRALVRSGVIESRGNLHAMRASEVRICATPGACA